MGSVMSFSSVWNLWGRGRWYCVQVHKVIYILPITFPHLYTTIPFNYFFDFSSFPPPALITVSWTLKTSTPPSESKSCLLKTLILRARHLALPSHSPAHVSLSTRITQLTQHRHLLLYINHTNEMHILSVLPRWRGHRRPLDWAHVHRIL